MSKKKYLSSVLNIKPFFNLMFLKISFYKMINNCIVTALKLCRRISANNKNENSSIH